MEARIASWGYFLLPSSHPSSPGSPSLIVAIRSEPTGEHYDPEVLHLCLRTPDGLVRWTDLTRHPSLQPPATVVLGKLSLCDRVDKRLDFFTFGASLDVETTVDEAIYTLVSSAPILELGDSTGQLPDHLAAEVEGLIAACHARWGRDNDGFVRRLAALEPCHLYVASLHSIYQEYREISLLRKEYPSFYNMLLMEKERLVRTNSWNNSVPDLETLLCPG